jgi:hypothetical protein
LIVFKNRNQDTRHQLGRKMGSHPIVIIRWANYYNFKADYDAALCDEFLGMAAVFIHQAACLWFGHAEESTGWVYDSRYKFIGIHNNQYHFISIIGLDV